MHMFLFADMKTINNCVVVTLYYFLAVFTHHSVNRNFRITWQSSYTLREQSCATRFLMSVLYQQNSISFPMTPSLLFPNHLKHENALYAAACSMIFYPIPYSLFKFGNRKPIHFISISLSHLNTLFLLHGFYGTTNSSILNFYYRLFYTAESGGIYIGMIRSSIYGSYCCTSFKRVCIESTV